MHKTKISQVEMTGPAVVGLLFGIAGAFTMGPVGGFLGFIIGAGPLALYRITSRP